MDYEKPLLVRYLGWWCRYLTRPLRPRPFTKTVAIIGAGQRSLPLFWPSANETWGLKNVGEALILSGYNVTRCYWLDSVNNILKFWNDGTHDRLTKEWPTKYPGCKVVLSSWPDHTADPIKYPHIQLWKYDLFVKLFNSDYINNTAAMAIVEAIVEGYDEIHLHGIDYHPDEGEKELQVPRMKELIKQVACIAYWIRAAEDLGIKVRISPHSPLLDKFDQSRRGFRMLGVPLHKIQQFHTTNQNIFKEAHARYNLAAIDSFQVSTKRKKPKRPQTVSVDFGGKSLDEIMAELDVGDMSIVVTPLKEVEAELARSIENK